MTDWATCAVGDDVFIILNTGTKHVYRRATITRVTKSQAVAAPLRGPPRPIRFWRKDGYEVGGFKCCWVTKHIPASAQPSQHEPEHRHA